MKKIHRQIIIMLFAIGGMYPTYAQTTYTVTDVTPGTSGAADIIIAQAVTSANSGQDVIVYMNASGLCNLTTNINIVLTAGSLIIEKSPLATVPQGFVNPTGTIASFTGSGSTSSVSSLIGLQLPTTVTKTVNVFVRQCQIISTSAIFDPISSDFNPTFFVSVTGVSGTPLSTINLDYEFTSPTQYPNQFIGYGDTYIDFYNTNSNGDLLDYLGSTFFSASNYPNPSNTISDVYDGSYVLNIPSGVTLNLGDEIAATVSSGQGGRGNIPYLGTSQAFYFNATPPPCCKGALALAYNSGLTCLSQPKPASFGVAVPGELITKDYPYHATTCNGTVVTFSVANTFNCSCTNTLVYTWDFGDGYTTTGCNASHAYTTDGSYTLSVVSSNTVIGACTPTTVSLAISVSNCCPPSNLHINATQSGGPSVSPFCPGNITLSGDINQPCGVNPAASFVWTFSNGYTTTQTMPAAFPFTHSFLQAGGLTYTVSISSPNCSLAVGTGSFAISGNCAPPPPCDVCIGSFAPIPGQQYMFGAWVKQGTTSSSNALITYTTPNVILTFTGGGSVGPFYAQGTIIDGWQRIEEQFTVPASATDITVNLINGGSTDNVFFDDIRIHPFNSNLKSFVYDPTNLRLMAELDQNNYATFYEYDEEGKLIRVKKETERGVFTIKEAFNSTQK